MVNIQDLSRIDLNLLVVFHVMSETLHVTRAADRLGLSQPALSHSLKKLRDTWGDPLFVKTPKGMIPTERAQALAPAVEDLLTRIDRTILLGRAWDLTSAERTFRIQSTDFLERMLLPQLIPSMEREAPATSISFTTARFSLPKEELESGRTDLAVAGFFGELPPGFYRQKVFQDEFCGAVRAKHPRLGKKTKVSLEEFCRERHMIIAPGGELSGQIDRELTKAKLSRRVAVGLSSFMSSGGILAETDNILVGPSKLFQCSGSPLRTFALPIPLRPIQFVQVWHERNHQDPHHQWLRGRVRDILGG